MTNRFKGLDLIKCLKNYGRRFVTLSGGGDEDQCQEKEIQKGKRKKETYTHLNAEFQKIARDKKAFFSDQCNEIEENNRMGKTRDPFKKIKYIKRIFNAKMGTIK